MVHEHDGGVPRAGERGPPAQSRWTRSRRGPRVKIARDGLREDAIMVRELIGTKSERREDFGIGAVGDARHQ